MVYMGNPPFFGWLITGFWFRDQVLLKETMNSTEVCFAYETITAKRMHHVRMIL